MGLFITLEGPDGSGKTTQMDMLQDELSARGFPILRTREPGGTPIAEKIRALLLDPENKEMSDRTEALLYAAARAQHVAEKIRPALTEGKIVLCDRFVDSSLVYQGIGRGLGVQTIWELNQFALDGLVPDVTVLIQIDYEEGLRRKAAQKGSLDRLEQQKNDFHRKVHDGFFELEKNTSAHIIRVDGVGSLESVHAKIMKELQPYLKEYENRNQI